MAEDKKITQLDPLAEAGPNDLFPIVSYAIPGTPTTERITTTALFANPQPIGAGTPDTGEFTELTIWGGITIDEFTNNGSLSGITPDTSLPTEYAVKTYVDNVISNLNPDKIWEDTSYVEVIDDGTTAGYVTIVTDGAEVAHFDNTGLTLANGSYVNEFSIDGTLIGDSDNAVPTEQAVKTYIDTAMSGISHDKIWEDTSYVEVIDDGTTAGYVTIVADGAEVANFKTDTQFIGLFGDDLILIDQTSSIIAVSDDQINVLSIVEEGIKLISGATVKEFSIDGTLVDDSDTVVPTEKAVKTYVDTSISNIAHDKIYENDSYVDVVDTGVGYVTIVTDGVEIAKVNAFGVSVYKNLIVSGDLYVDGTTWVVHDQEVTTSDNMIVINYGEIGPGVTSGFAGFEIDRGTLTNYRFIFEESSDTFRIGEIGSLQAVAAREDSPVDNNVAWWNDSDSKFDTQGDTFINIDQTTNIVVVSNNSVETMTLDENGLTLEIGTTVKEFSIDGTLAGNSDTAAPTEKAVKTYIDSGDTATLNSATSYTDVEIANLKLEVDLINTKHVNSDSTAVTGDVLLVDTSAATVIITLQRSVDGKILIKKTKAENTVTVQADGGLIDGLASRNFSDINESYTYICDGDNFYIF